MLRSTPHLRRGAPLIWGPRDVLWVPALRCIVKTRCTASGTRPSRGRQHTPCNPKPPAIVGSIGNAAGLRRAEATPLAQPVDPQSRLADSRSQHMDRRPGKPCCEAQHVLNKLPSDREPNNDRDLKIHKRVARKQDR